MQYFVPEIKLPMELPKQSAPEDKFGGVPWGLESDTWPKCSDCGKSQSFLAQLLHDPVRLNLGREGRVLFVFQCNHDPGMCSTWEGGSGANACFVVEPEHLSRKLSDLPADAPLVENEVRVLQWVERDDGLPLSVASAFFDDSKYYALPEEQRGAVTSGTRLGGVPNWIQSPSEAPRDGWQFVGQFDSTHSFLTAPKTQAPWVGVDAERWEGRTHYGEGPNYGDGGIAYLFLKLTDTAPQGWFFWQCG
jgi:hypothetical protein